MTGDRKIVMALVDGGELVRHVQAREQTSCLMISTEQNKALTEETPPIMRLLLARMVRKLRRTTDIAFGK
jgi:CRP/FNR family transcriptional regulator, cyclic AMP receptor protein